MNEENSNITENNQVESSSGGKMKIIIFIIPIVLIILTVAAYFIYTNTNYNSDNIKEELIQEEQNKTTQETTPSSNSEKTEENNEEVMGMDDEVSSFTVTAGNFYFEPRTITVNKGDKVKITLNNVEGTHDWFLDEFDAKSEIIQTGQTTTIEFTAEKSGSFEYYCSIGNHRTMGMVGTLTVQ